MKKKQNKVLIIKVGYSETFDPEISSVTSYGDVLRSTVLLHIYKHEHVTWLVDEKAYPILKSNPFIDRILIYNLTSVLQLESEHFDTVINLEKVPGLCALADRVTAWRRYGFRFDVKSGEAEAYDGTHYALSVCQDEKKKREHNRYWQEHLFEMVGSKWNDEEYVLGYKAKSKEVYDIGFNYKVGNKWPLKAWSEEYWTKLESLINGKYTISWQQGLENMEEYFDWINSCRVIVTNDSFGMHVGIVMKKNIICLFGPTNHRENYLYGLGEIVSPKDFECAVFPCKVKKCINFNDSCLDSIEPELVFEEIEKYLTSSAVE